MGAGICLFLRKRRFYSLELGFTTIETINGQNLDWEMGLPPLYMSKNLLVAVEDFFVCDMYHYMQSKMCIYICYLPAARSG